MDYRDERHALRGRVDQLEQELASVRAELARDGEAGRARRIAELEAQLADGQRLLEKLRGELAELRGEAPAGASARSAVMPLPVKLILLAVVGGTVAYGVAQRIGEGPLVTDRVSDRVSDHRGVLATPPLGQRAEVRRRAFAHWVAPVTTAVGQPLAVGSPCSVDAELESDGSAIRVTRLAVRCGGAVVYDSEATTPGTAVAVSRLEEDGGPLPGTFRYGLEYQDKRARTRVSINSTVSAASVWTDDAPAFRLELAVPRWTEAAAGQPLLEATKAVLYRKAIATRAEGRAPITKGAACFLRATPKPAHGAEDQLCLVRLRCGDDDTYGAPGTGLAPCSVADGRVRRITDTEPTSHGGDPMLDVDVGAGTMRLADDAADGSRWSVELALDPAAE